jgi:hypothetical protein
MKKLLSSVIVLLAVSASSIYAQKKQAPVSPSMPVDSITHKITYEGVVEVTGAKADLLYKRALAWFKTHYPNPTEVIRENDSLKFKIVGKPRFKVYNPADKNGLKTDAGLAQYTITVACRDGRYRYEISEYNWKQVSYYPAEKWMDTKDQLYSPAMADYLTQLDTYTKDLVKSLQEAMAKDKPVKDRDNW